MILDTLLTLFAMSQLCVRERLIGKLVRRLPITLADTREPHSLCHYKLFLCPHPSFSFYHDHPPMAKTSLVHPAPSAETVVRPRDYSDEQRSQIQDLRQV